MSKTGEHKDVLYLDIETFAGKKPSLDEIKADARLKDPVKIQADKEGKQDKEWRKQALDSIEGRVWCIGYAVNDKEVQCFTGATEKDALSQLDDLLTTLSFPTIVGHNLIDFDALFLFHRGLRYGFNNIVTSFSGDKKSFFVDTMRVMDGPSWKKMTSLDRMCKLLGFDGKGDIHGSMVHDLILKGKYEEVTDYCISDVILLRQCFLKLRGFGLC